MNMNLGLRIREFRQQAGLTQEKLAWAAGIAPAFLGQVERGVKSPTVKTLDKIAGALHISVGELFTGPFNPTGDEDGDIKQIVYQLQDLPKDEVHQISLIIEHIREIRRYERKLIRK